jgi:hypothetical protein
MKRLDVEKWGTGDSREPLFCRPLRVGIGQGASAPPDRVFAYSELPRVSEPTLRVRFEDGLHAGARLQLRPGELDVLVHSARRDAELAADLA